MPSTPNHHPSAPVEWEVIIGNQIPLDDIKVEPRHHRRPGQRVRTEDPVIRTSREWHRHDEYAHCFRDALGIISEDKLQPIGKASRHAASAFGDGMTRHLCELVIRQ